MLPPRRDGIYSRLDLMRQRPSQWFTWDMAVADRAAAGSFTSLRKRVVSGSLRHGKAALAPGYLKQPPIAPEISQIN